MSWWLVAPLWVLVIAALLAGAFNVFAARYVSSCDARSNARRLLVAAIPLGFLVSSLDCTGLSVHGCSPFCTFVKLAWIPLIASACIVYVITENQRGLTTIVLMSFVPLVPHCICYNVGNAWWIERIGVSPLCYGWGFIVSVIAVGALIKGPRYWPSLTICFTVIAGALSFFVAHHYFHFPW
jgi:hypothetical protein